MRLLEPVRLDRRRRALVLILADEPSAVHERDLALRLPSSALVGRVAELGSFCVNQRAPNRNGDHSNLSALRAALFGYAA